MESIRRWLTPHMMPRMLFCARKYMSIGLLLRGASPFSLLRHYQPYRRPFRTASSLIRSKPGRLVLYQTTSRPCSSSSSSNKDMPSSNKKGRKKFYAVAAGRETGIFLSWPECQAQIAGFKGAKFKSFTFENEAKRFLKQHAPYKKEVDEAAQAKKDLQPYQVKNFGSISAEETKALKDNDNKKKPPADSTATTATTVVNPYKRSLATRLEDKMKRLRESSPSPPPSLPYFQKAQIHVMFDGGSRGNPGLAGSGVYIACQYTPVMKTPEQTNDDNDDGDNDDDSKPTTLNWQNRRVTEMREFLGQEEHTNNQAEYMGMCVGLEQGWHELQRVVQEIQQQNTTNQQQSPVDLQVEFIVEGDSKLIIKQMKGEYKVRHELLKPYYARAQIAWKKLVEDAASLLSTDQIKVSVDAHLSHVRRENNSRADSLANEAMTAERSWIVVSEDGEFLFQREGRDND